MTKDAREKCTGFAKAFVTKATLRGGGQFIPRGQTYNKFPEFRRTPNEIKRWLEKLNPGNASGPNAISPKVYKSPSRALYRQLHAIYERMLELREWLQTWKRSAVCPIYRKKGSRDLHKLSTNISVLNKGRIAKTHLMRMRPYTINKSTALYKTLIWSALEQGSACYAHANEAQLTKFELFQKSK
ncbi:hypothetical protein CAPTEDRAFT_218215 [Capitella teleta]|uniref:Uncharacterized protein n=1 Tax=Capitella teleta TaxID=283909 RepID=R7VIU7_CAPTE|nr:hypothetical protein CAPTEDRAFT_218215 [Capitella teleta]|eukprot:ELU16196.1 hypothetical protein CAPTEDRAFT_218215 [Capitella teleta]